MPHYFNVHLGGLNRQDDQPYIKDGPEVCSNCGIEFESDKVIDSAVKPFINSLSKHGENL